MIGDVERGWEGELIGWIDRLMKGKKMIGEVERKGWEGEWKW